MICNLANAHVGSGVEEMLRMARVLIDGYTRIVALEEQELRLLGDIWLVRCSAGSDSHAFVIFLRSHIPAAVGSVMLPEVDRGNLLRRCVCADACLCVHLCACGHSFDHAICTQK